MASTNRNQLTAVSKPVWHIPLLCVQWKTSDDGQRNCPKHVEFYSKNKFEKLVHLVGFILRISAVYLGLVLGRVAMWQVLFRTISFSPVSIIPPMLHTHLHPDINFVKASRRSPAIFKQSYAELQTFVLLWMLYAFFSVIPRRLNFICRRFGTLCLFHLHRQVGMKNDWIWEKLEYLYRKRFGSKIAWENKIGSVPKRRHIKFRRRGITQKKAYEVC